MRMKFPDGVEEIVRTVQREKSDGKYFGHSDDNEDEDAALEIIKRVKSKAIVPGHDTLTEPVRAVEDLHWAAKQYFRLLHSDLRKCKMIRDHEEM